MIQKISQNIILERSDLEKMRNGEMIIIKLPGGNEISLSLQDRRGGLTYLLPDGRNRRDAIYEMLKADGLLPPRIIANRLNISPREVYGVINYAIKHGKLKKVGNTYIVPSDQSKETNISKETMVDRFLLALKKNGPITAKGIHEQSGLEKKRVYNYLSRFRRLGMLKETNEGYTLKKEASLNGHKA